MVRFTLPALAALSLAALAAQSQATGASQTSGFGWHLGHEGDTAKLAYGVANSDQLALMLTCGPGEARAAVYGDAIPIDAGLIQTSIETPIDPLSGGLANDSHLGLNGKAMRRLINHGRLAVATEAGPEQLTATQQERRLIENFVSYCTRSRA